MERRSQRIQTRKSSSSNSVNNNHTNGNGNELQLQEKKFLKKTKREDLQMKKRREYNFLLEDLSSMKKQQKDEGDLVLLLKKCFSNHTTVIPPSSSSSIQNFNGKIFCNEFIKHHKEKEDEFFIMENYQNELKKSIEELKQLQKELELQKILIEEKEKMQEEVQLQRELLHVLFSKDSLLLQRIYSKWLLQGEDQGEERSMSDVLLKLQCSKDKKMVF
ncbi:hypothetical protein MP638_000461 [Amoeboaphelidium occidentale]|nr:hypothetical protein MP638_000461 [Amoeboaphelidium occidentale]